ncbi:MAG: SEC-C metal-binding domain-containing protein [Bryobacteraceae bacterium]
MPSVVLIPENYAAASTRELLDEAARGHLPLDQRWVRAIVERGLDAADELVRFGLEQREEDVIDLDEDLIPMLRYLRTERALPFFAMMVERQPDEISDELLSAFMELGAVSLEPLLAVFEKVGAAEGGEVAFMLAALRIHDPRVRAILLARLDVDPTDAAIAISLYGDPEMKPALEAKLAALDEKEPATETERHELVDAIRALDAPKAEPHQEPFDLWELYPEQSLPPFSALPVAERLGFLASSSAEYRAGVVESFVNDSYPDEVRVRLLEVADKDADTTVRAAAWRALADAADDKSVRKAMLTRLMDERAPLEERSGALIGLSLEPDEPIARKMRDFYGIPAARASAMEAMWRSLDRRFAEYFPRHLDDADMEIRRQAVWGVGYLGIGGEAARLRKLFGEEELREDALFAYALSVPAEISRGRMNGLFNKVQQDAGGLSDLEAELIQVALDQRLAFHGLEPVFFPEEDEEGEDHHHGHAEPVTVPAGIKVVETKVGRNDPCPCGSGKKFKKCCGADA